MSEGPMPSGSRRRQPRVDFVDLTDSDGDYTTPPASRRRLNLPTPQSVPEYEPMSLAHFANRRGPARCLPLRTPMEPDYVTDEPIILAPTILFHRRHQPTWSCARSVDIYSWPFSTLLRHTCFPFQTVRRTRATPQGSQGRC